MTTQYEVASFTEREQSSGVVILQVLLNATL